MFYIDNITKGSEIINYQKRIDEVDARTNLNEDIELTNKLGGCFWDVERQACRQVEEELFFLMKKRGINIELPQDIPQLIKREVFKIVDFSGEILEKEKSNFSIDILTEAQSESKVGRRNEDTFVVLENDDILVAAVLDGATELASISGVQDSQQQGGRFAAQKAAFGIEKKCQETESAEEILLAANQQIRESLVYQGHNPDESAPEFLPNTQAVLAVVKKNKGEIEIVQTGDAVCLVELNDGQIELAMPPDITPQDIEALKLSRSTSLAKNIDLKDTFNNETISRLMIAGRALCNKEDGSGVGVLNGQKSAEKYIKSKKYQLADVKKIILLTDGLFLPTEDIDAEPDWHKMVDIINKGGIERLYQEVLALKNQDPQLNKYPRFKKHDDATGVTIEMSNQNIK